MRIARLSPLLLLAGLLVPLQLAAPAPTLSPAASSSSYEPALPVNATVYYAVEKQAPSRVHPDRPVDENDVEVIHNTIADMQYAGQQVGIYSWFGQNSFPDKVFGNHLRAADDTTFRWSILDENEGTGNPSVAAIRSDLNDIYSKYGQDPSYFRVGGKPVVFAYGQASDTCDVAARWRAADSSNRFYIVLKNVPSYTRCSPQPQSWYGYAPAEPTYAVGNSYDVSPGFNAASERSARLGRSVSRFAAGLRAMKASKVRFKITTTWNEWSQATGVESAKEWDSGSHHGAYVDQMHSILGQAVTTPAPPAALNAVTSGQDIKLGWSLVSGASSYLVFRNGCLIATTTTNSYVDSKLANGSASYFVKAANFRGTSRRGPVKIGAAGSPSAAPRADGTDGIVAMRGERILSTASGSGTGCASRQGGQAVVAIPSDVPSDATAVVLTLTSFNSQGNGAVQVFPAGSGSQGVSQLRYYSSRASSNTTTVPIGTARQLVIQESGAATHLYVDVIGYTEPGADGLATRPATVFYNSRSSSASVGGTPSKKVQGTVTYGLPSLVPADASAVEVRALVSGADGPGNLTVFNGSSTPGVTSLAYDTSVILTNSVLVPVTAGRTISFTATRSASVALAVEGWTLPSGQKVTVGVAKRLATSTTRHTSVDLSLPDDEGDTILLNVGVASALGYGNLSVSSDGASTPQIQTVSYGPQQPQSGFLWVRVPANGLLHVTLSSGALVYVDQVALG